MNYKVNGQRIELETPIDFDFDQCLVYLARSDIECLHRVIDKTFYKVLDIQGKMYMIKVYAPSKELERQGGKTHLIIEVVNTLPGPEVMAQIADYVWRMLDLNINLSPFYKLSTSDPILNELVLRYKGLRIIKILDLYEGLCWAIIGQQINLKFAYTLKSRICENYGKVFHYEGHDYYVFPEPKALAHISVEDLKALQFTGRKSEYLIGVSKLFEQGSISKAGLEGLNDFEAVQSKLMDIRGIGHWTADYAILKCLDYTQAFLIADVGIHNGLKVLLGRDKKPSKDEILEMAKAWRGWESYATFFIWRSLY